MSANPMPNSERDELEDQHYGQIAPLPPMPPMPPGEVDGAATLPDPSSTVYRLVPLRELHIPRFQRERIEPLISRIARNFKWDLFQAALVYRDAEDGNYYVIDGRQRTSGLWVNYPDGEVAVPCLVYEGITYHQAARIFKEIGVPGSRRSLSAGDIMRAELEAGEEQARDIIGICEELGITLDYNSRIGSAMVNNIRAVASARGIYRIGGREHFRRTLYLLRESFPEDDNAFAEFMLKGMSRFLLRYGDLVEDRRVIHKMRGTTTSAISRRASAWAEATKGKRGTHAARAIHAEMNSGLRAKRLPEWTE